MNLCVFSYVFMFVVITKYVHCSLKIYRGTDKDTLICDNEIDCARFNAIQQDETSCSCNGTLFFEKDKGLKCYKDTRQVEGCLYHFDFYLTKIQAVEAANPPNEFLYQILTGESCSQLLISKVEWLGNDAQWKLTINQFNVIRAETSFYLRWKNTADMTSYSGQQLKLTLICQSVDGNTHDSCLFGKIVGEKSWNEDKIGNEICRPSVSTTAGTVISTGTIPSKPSSQQHPTRNSKHAATNTSQDGDANIGIIAAVIGGLAFLIMVAIAVKCFYQKKKAHIRKQSVREEEKKESEGVYYQMKESDNPSYLTSLQTNENTNVRLNADNADYIEPPNKKDDSQPLLIHTKPSTKRIKPSSQTSSPPEDYLELQDEYETLKPSSLPNYERLSISEDVQDHQAMHNEDTDDDEYSYPYKYDASGTPTNDDNKPSLPNKDRSGTSPHDYFEVEKDLYQNFPPSVESRNSNPSNNETSERKGKYADVVFT